MAIANIIASKNQGGMRNPLCTRGYFLPKMRRFRASKETSKKSSSKIDEEGIQVAVCRHRILLRGLNHYRGEVFAYPMFLQRELSEKANVTFFCMDVVCRYWPYLSKVTEESSDLQPLMEMRPFLTA
ncbi:hypothetical protein R3I93_004675 [Phoxinus phoxinus]|uniref:Uncharacterized protein n=1 Tax=Phoxinus phoxinus TaxID=58324 RepID=A0AAN9HEF5_9TELE